MFDMFWLPELQPFTIALIIMLVIALLEGVGLLLGVGLSTLFDSLLPDIDFDINEPSGALTHFMGWMNIGRVPLLAIIICFLTSFGAIGYLIQSILYGIMGIFLPSALAIVLSFAMALPATRITTNAIRKVIPSDESSALSQEDLIGSAATITLGRATKGSPAEAKYVDKYEQAHYFMVEPEEVGIEFKAGETVILAKQSPKGFYAIKNTLSQLEKE